MIANAHRPEGTAPGALYPGTATSPRPKRSLGMTKDAIRFESAATRGTPWLAIIGPLLRPMAHPPVDRLGMSMRTVWF